MSSLPYRLLLSDIDGTLIPYRSKQISKANIDALLRMQSKGVRVALCSGRPKQGMIPFAEQLQLECFQGFLICNNGAQIIDFQSKEMLYQKTLKPAQVEALYEQSVLHHNHVMMMQDDYMIMKGYDEAVAIDHEEVHTDFIWPYDCRTYLHRPTMRMTFTNTPEVLDQLQLHLQKAFKQEVQIVRSQRMFLDVVPKGVDKGEAMQFLATHLQLTLADIIACGDGNNDLRMVADAGLGIAVKSAMPEVLAVAKAIGPTPQEDVMAWLEKQYFN